MTTEHTGLPDEVAIRIMDYLDGEMSEEERSAFETEVQGDPALRKELEAMQSTMGVVQGLQMKFAPDHFVAEVESKVRTRSRGRFFGYQALYSSRIPYEVFAVVAIAIMAGMWMMSSPDDARFSADLALAGEKEDAGESGGGELPDAGAEAAGAGIEPDQAPRHKEAAVRPLKTEVIEYRLTLPAGSGASELETMATQIAATSRQYVVERKKGELEVTVPAKELDGFLRDWTRGGKLERKTITREGDPGERATVIIRTP